jgi:hypothetical protein
MRRESRFTKSLVVHIVRKLICLVLYKSLMPYLSTAEKSLDSLICRESRSRKSLVVQIVRKLICLLCTLEKLNALLEHRGEEPGLLDAQGVAVQEKLTCPYCEKAFLASTVEKLNCLFEKSLIANLSTAEKSLNSLMRRESRSMKSLVVHIVRKLVCLVLYKSLMPYLSTAEKSLDSLMRRESRSRKSLVVHIVRKLICLVL